MVAGSMKSSQICIRVSIVRTYTLAIVQILYIMKYENAFLIFFA